MDHPLQWCAADALYHIQVSQVCETPCVYINLVHDCHSFPMLKAGRKWATFSGARLFCLWSSQLFVIMVQRALQVFYHHSVYTTDNRRRANGSRWFNRLSCLFFTETGNGEWFEILPVSAHFGHIKLRTSLVGAMHLPCIVSNTVRTCVTTIIWPIKQQFN